MKPKFVIKDSYRSVQPYLKSIHRIRRGYQTAPSEHSAEAQKLQVKVLFENFPADRCHQRLKQLMQSKGEIVDHNTFRERMLKYAVRLHNSSKDMESCGTDHSQIDVTKQVDKDQPNPRKRPASEMLKGKKEEKDKLRFSSTSVCKGCGRLHPGDCRLAEHPDFNSSNLPWSLSTKGKKWAEKNLTVLPWVETLDGKGWDAPEQPKKKGRKDLPKGEDNIPDTEIIYNLYDTCSFINNDETNDDTINFVLSANNKKVRVKAFIDSGALASNYVSGRLAKWLRTSGSKSCPCATKICSPVNDTCVTNLNNKKYTFQLIHDLANINTTFNAVELDSKYDLIIGRQSLKDLRLIEKFAEHFLPHQDKKLTNKKKNKRLYQMIGKERRACTPPANSDDFSVSHWLSATLSLLSDGEMSLSNKRQLFLESIPDDDDEIAQYSHDAPWDRETTNSKTTLLSRNQLAMLVK